MAWEILAAAGISAAANLFGGKKKQAQYTPNPKWLAMKEDVMAGVQEGLAEGGYTFSEEVGEQLYRKAQEQIAQTYGGAERRITEAMAPHGNVGAMGRKLTNLNIARMEEEAKAGVDINLARENTKLQSYSNLLNLGAGISDPNLPQLQASMMNASQPQSNVFNALETGAATYLNLTAADESRQFSDKFFNYMVGADRAPLAKSNVVNSPIHYQGNPYQT